MNAEVKAMPSQNQSVKQNQMVIVGRLDSVTKYNKRFDHIVMLPAPDEFSRPSLVRLNASTPLGSEGEMVKCLAVWNGWPNDYKVTDEEGNRRSVHDVKGFFVAVE